MNYNVKRLEVTWKLNTFTVVAAVVGLGVAFLGFRGANILLLVVGTALYGGSIFMIARPVLSALLLILGLFGGLLTFFLVPNPEILNMTFKTKFAAMLMFMALYTVLMDTLLVVGSQLYNLLIQAGGLRGIGLELAPEEEERPEEATGA